MTKRVSSGVFRRAAVAAASFGAVLASGGCASVPPGAGSNPADPFERFNRHMFAFNDFFDRNVGEPVAEKYIDWIPKPVRNCVGNFFSNLAEIPTFVDTSLEGRPHDAEVSFGRLVLNSTFGVLGCLDLGPRFGLDRDKQDFGLTMGNWGVPPGPYLVLPILGPSSVRDAVGMVPDFYMNPSNYVRPVRYEYFLDVAYYVDLRAEVLDATQLINQVALDRYSFMRDSYLQLRTNLVYHGNPPPPIEDEGDDSGDPGPSGSKKP